MSEPTLLPCPFCGSSKLQLGRKIVGHGDSVKSIHCSCGVEFAPVDWDIDVVKAWNTRSDLRARIDEGPWEHDGESITGSVPLGPATEP